MLILIPPAGLWGQTKKLPALKQEALQEVDKLKDFTQQMVDMIFSFGELGFQEFETSRYITTILRENGFSVEEGVSGMPTAWVARWGRGKPVIAFGSDIDCIPKASQKPGVAYHDPIIEGAPGHGEGHNSGQAVNVTAALVLKRLMEREKIAGTLMLWPGVAEEQLGAKAYFARDGVMKDVDAVLFTHVSDNLGVSFGPDSSGTGLVSVEYTFKGSSAHSAGAPWRGRSALDAVELMNIGWNFRREHLRLSQRSHYVISNGGDQPNVVPPLATVWYYFREVDYENIKKSFEIGNKIAQAAAMMTDTEVSWRILGAAWPRHFNKPIALAMYDNIKQVGLPSWSEEDQTLAKALQRELGNKEVNGLKTKLTDPPALYKGRNFGGGSDDIGDISWTVPTVTLRFPSNIPDLPGHHWANAVAMATPIAHKGATAGAKVMALTTLDLLLNPKLVEQAWDYFRNEQGKETQYQSFLSAEDKPSIHLNREIMAKYRPEMRKYYFDPSKHKTYLEQLGITYPTIRKSADNKTQ
ncbi:MAG: amidohydrolase [candidate division KSB1 bacterium]|nr:amidohydrolase [candidate division KSB1 bacterium]MDZ7367814.1 amidohydrolase [candidate division KSB1 bacterium]MDZ7404858.1 amidohydrolase [candidate division KSB1 bacterium]